MSLCDVEVCIWFAAPATQRTYAPVTGDAEGRLLPGPSGDGDGAQWMLPVVLEPEPQGVRQQGLGFAQGLQAGTVCCGEGWRLQRFLTRRQQGHVLAMITIQTTHLHTSSCLYHVLSIPPHSIYMPLISSLCIPSER